MEWDDFVIFFTSDLHIGHDKEFIYKPRGFSSMIEHDDAIVKNWNEDVHPTADKVYIAGDVMMGTDYDYCLERLNSLNGQLCIIRGNHETNKKFDFYKTHLKNVIVEEMDSETYVKLLKFGKKTYYLSHYPSIMGPFARDDGKLHTICLHGHTHSPDRFQFIEYSCYNIALDAHNNRPVSLEEIRADITQKREEMLRELREAAKTNR